MNAMSPQPQSQTIAFTGGLDLVTPPIQIPPGRVIAGFNYEPRAEGYRRIEGYERRDGQTAPSAASYSYITFNAGNTALTANQTVTGGTSGATGILLINGVLQSGAYGSSNAVGYLVLTEVTGTFQTGEALKVAAVTKATSTSAAEDRGALTDALDATWLAAAVLRARTAILPIPGGGPTRGANFFGGFLWGFRDDDAVAPTKCRMYKATAAGWVLQSLGYSLPFTLGQAAGIAAGNTITGNTSAATAVVSRVLITSGAFATNDAVGRLILSAVTGVFVAETIKVAGTVRATIAAAPTANVLAAGGRYELINENFYGATSQGAMYGVNGVGFGFEWDGTIFTPISTGAADERPIHIAAQNNHLFLAYRNGGLTASQAGAPQGYDGTLGAATFGFGADITGLMPMPGGIQGGTLAVFGRTRISILYGTGTTDWLLSPLTIDAGAIEWTLQMVGTPTYMDDAGVRTLSTTQAFGDFKLGTLTGMVQPLLDNKRKVGVTPVASLRVRAKSQYRIFFSDGTGLSIFIGGKVPSILPFDFGTLIARFTTSCIDSNNDEILLLGGGDGYVYQLDKGTSLDSANITGFLRFPFNHSGSPNQNKRYQKISTQVDANPEASLYLTASFSDGDPDQPPTIEQDFDVRGGGGFWDESYWNQFYFSSRVKGLAEAHIDGLGTNISVTIGTAANDEEPHTLHSMTLLFSPRGPVR